MTRRSKRELERALDDLGDSPDDGIDTVIIRKWRSDPDTGEPAECYQATEHDIETGASRDLDVDGIDAPADLEGDR
ncbi:hypothetical protein NDI54_05915 [Haloarcula sp. S1AR25-5A]|uniref:Uncharacterized protein n=1 Tax=Haloarcula terrestris TaxID=2950533 RepID=A0AAE4EVG4_9EURY|nr:hypothetical protein [Haloarcula terrestris]MDS0220890.1 hypothetical protein [Haloarcula terrestris]